MPADRADRSRGSDYDLSNTVTPSTERRSTSSRFTHDASTPESALTSLSPSPEPLPPPIVVRGHVLQPTVVFDTLWKWLVERKRIDDKRRAGMPAPWTDDEILRKYKFCNAYRVLDRTSQFVVTDVIEKGPQDRTEMLFRILLFNCFNRIETWNLLIKAFRGTPTYAAYDIHAYDKVLKAAMNKKVTLFTGAYMKIAKRFDYNTNHMGHLQLLEMFMEKLPDVLARAKYAADVYEEIAAFPGMAEFTSYQLMLSLSYSPLLNFAANDFVVPGLGASSGLAKMFGASLTAAAAAVPDMEAHVLRHLATHQKAYFARLGLDFPPLRDAAGGARPLDVADLEHAVCEVDKYARLKHPDAVGTSLNRTHLQRKFHASEAGLPKVPVLPKAWAHPARRVSRIRAAAIEVDQRYVCTRISAHQLAEDGDGVEYLVWWFGYTKPTWEPRETILEDAPAIVAEYEAKLGKKTKKARR